MTLETPKAAAAPAVPPQAPVAPPLSVTPPAVAPAKDAPPAAAQAVPPVDPAADARRVQQEVQHQQRTAKVRADEAALATAKAALDVQRAQVQRGLELDAAIRSGDPLRVLAVAGFSHDQYTAAQITAIEKAKADQALAASPITVAEVEAKIDANRKALEQKFQDDLAGRDRKVEESRKAALDAEAVQWTADADAYIAAHADDLVLTSVRGSGQALGQLVADDAYQRAEKNEAGQVVKWPAKLLTIEEAAKKFEESEAAKEAKIAERRKAKSAVVPETTQAQPPKIAAPGAPPVPPPAPRALTADMGGSQTGAKPVYRSASEKIAAAIAAGEAARDRK